MKAMKHYRLTLKKILKSIPNPEVKYLWDVSLAINLCRVLLLLLGKYVSEGSLLLKKKKSY